MKAVCNSIRNTVTKDNYAFLCPFGRLLYATVLSIPIRFTASDYLFDIFKQFLRSSYNLYFTKSSSSDY